MTIKDIEKQLKDTQGARDMLAKNQRENEAKAKEYREKADTAAAAGDVATYKEYKALADDAEAVAYVCGKQLEAEQGNPVTIEQTREAWDEYAADYNKKLSAKLRKFEAAKADMLREYAAAVELQLQACATREWLADIIDKRPLFQEGEGILAQLYPMDYIPCASGLMPGLVSIGGANIKDADAVYYLSSFKLDGNKLYEDARQKMVTCVVGRHRAV